MFFLNAISSRVKDRYKHDQMITTQSTANIPTSARHELADQIESTLHMQNMQSISPPVPVSPSLSPVVPTVPPSSTSLHPSLSPSSPHTTNHVGVTAASATAAAAESNTNYRASLSSTTQTLSSKSLTSNTNTNTNTNTISSTTIASKKRQKIKDEKLIIEINNTIHTTKVTLNKMKESENFLDTRIRKYRSLLDKQSVKLCSRHLVEGNDYNYNDDVPQQAQLQSQQSQNDHFHGQSHSTIPITGDTDNINNNNANTNTKNNIDIEKEADIKKQFYQHEQNEKKLNNILQVQKNILTEIEIMNRKIKDLETKRDLLIVKVEECELFLITSAEVDMNISNMHMNTSMNMNMNSMQMNSMSNMQGEEYIAEKDARVLEMRNLNPKKSGRRLSTSRGANTHDDDNDSSIIEVI